MMTPALCAAVYWECARIAGTPMAPHKMASQWRTLHAMQSVHPVAHEYYMRLPARTQLDICDRMGRIVAQISSMEVCDEL